VDVPGPYDHLTLWAATVLFLGVWWDRWQRTGGNPWRGELGLPGSNPAMVSDRSQPPASAASSHLRSIRAALSWRATARSTAFTGSGPIPGWDRSLDVAPS